VVLLAALCFAAPALALSQRGHRYSFSFAGKGSGEGQLSEPDGVAVSEVGTSAGDVYVVDRANNRIEKFDGKGKFMSTWGWGVKDGTAELQLCKAGEGCKAGTPGKGKGSERLKLGKGQLVAPTMIAIDNSPDSADPSRGDVYVVADVADEKSEVDKFGPEGEYLGQLTGKEERESDGRVQGIAVDASGTVWVEWSEDEIERFTDEEPNKNLKKLEERKTKEVIPELEAGLEVQPLAPGFAIDFQHDLYVDYEPAGLFQEALNTASRFSEEGRGENGEQPCEASSCFAAKLTSVAEPARELGAGEALIEALDQDNTSDVAVDPNAQSSPGDDVYLDNGTSIAALNPEGALLERFGTKTEAGHEVPVLQKGAGIAVDAGRNVYIADSATGQVDVFSLEEPAAPTIEDISAQDVSSQAVGEEVQVHAQLDATIDPRGAQTDYHFQYGTAPCASSPSACAEVPGGEIAQDFGDEGFGEAQVSVHLGDSTSFPLLPRTIYHYRVTATNQAGGKPNETLSAQEGTFSTPPASGPFIADQRDWEMVSPPDKDGAAVELTQAQAGGVVQAAANGSALTYIANGPFAEPEGSRSIEPTQILSTRGEAGDWSSKDIITPNSAGEGIHPEPREYELFSTNLALALLQPFSGGSNLAEPPLAPPATPAEAKHQEKTPYLRADPPLSPEPSEAPDYEAARHNGEVMENAGYLPLLTAANVPGAPFGREKVVSFVTATPDLSHVVLGSKVALGSPLPAGGEYGLYEWNKGSFQPVGVLPGEEEALAEKPRVGSGSVEVAAQTGASEDLRHAISDDGSRIFWTADEHLYMRDTASAQTIQLDAPAPESEAGAAFFQTASADGSRVFFTDTQPLTGESGKTGADLYVCEISEDKCKLSDLTSEHEGESADVQRLVLGASEDGSYVYFVANGVLGSAANAQGEKATPGDCQEVLANAPVPGHSCNLYLEHYDSEPGHARWQEPRFIARLSEADARAWQGIPTTEGHGIAPTDLGATTARVSSDGRFLTFMSQQRLTGYDNRATAPAANDAPAQEVYEYTAPTAAEEAMDEPGRLACASCDPSGARPVGLLDPSGEGSEQDQEGLGLLSDPFGAWAGSWLAAQLPTWTGFNQDATQALYQSRYLSDSGRLFFDSPEALVPQDINGKQDVYEYEPQGVPRGKHQCTSSAETFSARSSGCVGLISSGTSPNESAFLDASESGGEGEAGEELSEGGGDVFFLTAARLAPQDTDEAFDAYDAHECTSSQPCASTTALAPSPCQATSSCRPFSSSSAQGAAPVSATAPGNLTAAKSGVAPIKEVKKPTPAQQLAKALTACRKLKKHKQRAACETRAHRRYRAARLAQTLGACNKRKAGKSRLACEKQAHAAYGPAKKTRVKTARSRPSGNGSPR
jgi:hypothetical protein